MVVLIKTIPTKYNGIKFKSKLESKWAKWLDDNKIVWDYETQGFDINGHWYLPDFYLPESNAIIEVKGAMERIEKPYELINELKQNGFYDPDEKLMVLLAGPVPYFYNIHPYYSDGFYINKCKCGSYTIVTKLMSYSCRSCGYHDGLRGIRQNGYTHMDVLAKPLEWLLLEE